MRAFDRHKDILEFVQLANTRKCETADWMYIHISSNSPDCHVSAEEIEQFVQFYLSFKDAVILKEKNSVKDLLILKRREKPLVLDTFKRAFQENFADSDLTIAFQNFDSNSLPLFSRIIEPYVSETNVAAYISFLKLRRSSNCFVILDDDPMVLKQLGSILGNIGTVVGIQDANLLNETYRESAPDILFLDIHLKGAEGGELLKKIRKEIDPYAYVIMISSDTKKEIVIDIKKGGAKGFIVKPFNSQKLYNEISRVPGIIGLENKKS